MPPSNLKRACIAEVVGTFLLVFFGTGAVFVAVLTGALWGLMQLALVWGVAIGLAIYATAAVSGAHLNPAVSVAAAAFRRFGWRHVGPYVAAQLVGAFLASALLYAMFCNVLTGFEEQHNIARGEPGSQLSAMVFGEYFPNPAVFGTDEAAMAKVTHVQAMAAEAVGTALLVFFIFALTDPHNHSKPTGTLFAPFIGLTVAVIIAIIAPLTQAGINPARDLGPRLFSLIAGWGEIAIPGPRGGFLTVYIAAPIAGGLIGGGAYQFLLAQPPMPDEPPVAAEENENERNQTQ